jgi:hypothetical protein
MKICFRGSVNLRYIYTLIILVQSIFMMITQPHSMIMGFEIKRQTDILSRCNYCVLTLMLHRVKVS